jgi:hypothetical protein
MQWLPVTAIYIIGGKYPIATFTHENQAEEWAESQYPGEWIKKSIKIPQLPVMTKKAMSDPKAMAAMLANLKWNDEEEDGETQHGVQVDLQK